MTKNSEREQDLYLAHYGVLGMKWGVRKKNDKLSSRLRPKKKVSRKDLKKQRRTIIRDYYNTEGKIYYNNLSKTGGTTSKYNEAYKRMIKKYGKTKVDDAIKYNERETKATIAALSVVSLAGLAYSAAQRF